MGLDLGTLSMRITVEDSGVATKLDGTKRKLDDVAQSASKAEKININPKVDDRNISKAGDTAKGLNAELSEVDSKRVSPDVDTSKIRKAKDETNKLSQAVGDVAEKAVKWSAGAVAMAGIGTIGTAFTKGFGRLDALDQAEAKLEALGNSGRDIQVVMDNALASVKGTSFGIGDAASTAAVLVGAGVKPGEDLERTLKLVADSAAIAGVSFGEMGSIWGKVASSTVLSGEEMAQISDRSIGLQVALSEQLGVTALEAKKMVSEGKVSFADFETAMESLVGGGAVRMGDTVSGAMDNFGAALGRGGAAILESGFDALPSLLGAATDVVDDLTARVTPLAEEWGAKLAPHFDNFAQNLGPNVAASLGMISDAAGILTPLISTMGDTASNIPFPLIVGGLSALVAQNKGWIDNLNSGTGKMKEYGGQLGTGLSNALARAGTAYDNGSAKLNVIAQNHRLAAAAAKAQSLQTTDAFTSMDRMGTSAARSLAASTTQIGAGFSGMARGGLSLAKSGFDGVKLAAGGLMGALGGPWGIAIMGATTLLGYLTAEHFNAKQAEEEHKAAQQELAGTLDETTGKISAQTEELVRKRLEESGATSAALELGLSQDVVAQAALGNEEALQRVQAAVDNATVNAVTGSDAWAKYGANFEDAGISASTVADAMDGNTEAIRKINDAAAEYSSATGPGLNSQFKSLTHEVDGTNESVNTMRDTILQSAEDVAQVEYDAARNQLLELEDQVKTTSAVLEALGDTKFNLESATSISIEANDETLKTKELLDDIEGVTTEVIEGQIHIDFKDGYVVSDLLKGLGVSLEMLPTGHIGLDTTDMVEAQRMADVLGAQVQELPDGTLALNYQDIPEATALMEALGILVRDGADGELRINNEALTDSSRRTDDLRANVASGMSGTLTINDNIESVRQRLDRLNGYNTQSYHTVVSGTQTSTNGRTDMGRQVVNADGNVLEFYKNGGTRENHVAQIAPAGAWRVWAEDETGGEAYIPLAQSKRSRSENILAEVASRFGKTIIDQDAIAFADGGLSDQVISALSPYNNGRYVMGGFSPDATDCSAAVSMGVNAYLGLDPFDSRMSTVTEREWLTAKGFQEGRGQPGDLVVGWYDYGGGANGHTAMQLPDGTYIESGGNTGQGLTIGGAAGPLEGRGFTDFMYLPGTGGEDPDAQYSVSGGGSTSSYGGSGGSGGRSYGGTSSGGSGTSISKSVNGGKGALLEDGSFLELAAAIYSQQTGQPMADDVVSWGNVLGLGTTFEGEDLPRQQRNLERDQRSLERDHAATLRDIEQAKADLKKQQDELAAGGKETGSGKNKKFTAFTPEEIAERERKIADQQDRLLDLEDKLLDLADSQADLIKSQDELRVAIEKASAVPTSFGGAITPMANGGILGSLSRNAQISNGQSAVLWAEDGPEAYIPLSSNKKARSTDIWLETGKRLGYDVMGLLNLLGSGVSGLARGDLGGFNTGSSFSLADAGLNMDAVSYRGQQEVVNAVGANFYGPVQINDPRQYLESQLDTAQKQIHSAMKGLRNGR